MNKESVYKKWVANGYKQPATKEEQDIVLEYQKEQYQLERRKKEIEK
jgi:hypothetical protein